ncbi:PadR family transcriptional regulator [Phycicoccus sp. DTK01]|nr:PadR family transcriptional regulator [Phycicoccus sp. DTK01]
MVCDTHYRVGMTSPDDPTLAGHLQELRRGTVVVAALASLRTAGYGYALLETLGRAGFEVDANTLYPLLRRLEKQGLLTAEWNTEESRPRKFYRTSPSGEDVLAALRADWRALDAAITDLA